MRGSEEFDAFYQSARSRVLLQTYALTGDLPASRSAVRDAFVAAWHHWPKVCRLDDPEGWVRPHAWQHAQRRHTARIWHRDRSLDDSSRATLEALGKLGVTQRKALLLTQLGSSTLPEMAREVALTDDAASSALQSATSQFAVHRGVPSSSIRTHLEALGPRVADARFPRPSIIRRAGAARRRAHTTAGVLAAVVALFLSGMVVHENGGAEADIGAAVQNAPAPPPDEPEAGLRTSDLLDRDEINRLSPGRAKVKASTSDNTEGDGINVLCQRERFADPDGVAALVRTFDLSGRPELGAVQSLELSRSPKDARQAYRRALSWFGDCSEPRVQLLASHRLDGVGDEGMVLVLRSWREPVTTYTLGIARTGSLVSSTLRRTADGRPPRLQPMVRLTGASVARLCGQPEAGDCTTRPTTRPAPPPPPAEAAGMLQVVDLPPIDGIVRPWIATDPSKPKVNTAATRCDNADFRGDAVRRAATRSFLAPEAKVARTFGITQTVGRFGSPEGARAFVGRLRDRLAGCEDRDLTATVRQVYDRRQGAVEAAVWRVTTEVSDQRAVSFDMALVRDGALVSQIGFVPAPGRTMEADRFRALAERALERLQQMPGR
ncbi:sensor domain-containing protein [Nocardioides donggukensis]|uniref:Sensor domain-containing protein n=1 Tax=Nocardioides donggukensis TaxID=2774019 RepID=A0A927PYQ0_9ACTN|nr:sensor domain-containing protein [Nocardioides donggukensis]MBD8868633.1 sensor domain-containing protein [Nocardioides donggukensis]